MIHDEMIGKDQGGFVKLFSKFTKRGKYPITVEDLGISFQNLKGFKQNTLLT